VILHENYPIIYVLRRHQWGIVTYTTLWVPQQTDADLRRRGSN